MWNPTHHFRTARNRNIGLVFIDHLSACDDGAQTASA